MLEDQASQLDHMACAATVSPVHHFVMRGVGKEGGAAAAADDAATAACIVKVPPFFELKAHAGAGTEPKKRCDFSN